MTTRRALLAAAAAGLAGCGGPGGRAQIVVLWSGGELEQFRRVLRKSPVQADVVSAGDDIDAFLRARRRAGTSPDVAVSAHPGELMEYARLGWLSPVDSALADRFPPAWNDLLRWRGELYGVWVKAAHKSLFWYRPSVVGRPPDTWPELVDLVRDLAAAGGPAPLAIGAADGWVLTDWFENLLAALAPAGFYDALAAGAASWDSAPVRGALDLLAEVWSIRGAFPGGAARALLTEFEESVIQVVATRRAAMLFEADFVAGFAARFRPQGTEELATFRFPAVDGVRPLVVGGDAAVVLRGSRSGPALVDWLTTGEAFQPWISDGGYLSPNRRVDRASYPDERSRGFAGEMLADVPRFDLSDQLAGSLGGADGVGSWTILQDFFADVTGGARRLGGAVDRAVRRFAAAAS